MAVKRTCLQPKLLILKAFALLSTLLQDANLMASHGPEILHNQARFCHQAGLVSQAEPLYRRLLAEYPGCKFVRPAAYNLHLIYLQNGNHALARQILATHITI